MIAQAFTYSRPADVSRLARHLLRTDENEAVRVVGVRGMDERPELADMLHTMHRARAVTNGKNGLVQLNINPDREHGQEMTPEEWDRTLDAYEAEFGLKNQPRVIVEHFKVQRDGSAARQHFHVMYQTADVEHARQVDDFWQSGIRCGRVSRQLEKQLGHRQLPERSPQRSYDRTRHQQAKRGGASVEEQRQAIREAWSQSDSAQAFHAAVQAKGYELAAGRKGTVLVTPDGAPVNLTRELEGVKAKELRQRLEGLNLEPVEAVQARQQQRQREGMEAGQGQLSGERPPASIPRLQQTAAPSQEQEPERSREQLLAQFEQTGRDVQVSTPEAINIAAAGFAANWTGISQGETREAQHMPSFNPDHAQQPSPPEGSLGPFAPPPRLDPERSREGQWRDEMTAEELQAYYERNPEAYARARAAEQAAHQRRGAELAREAGQDVVRGELKGAKKQTPKRGQQFTENKRKTFRELFGKPKGKDRDQGLEHEIE